MATVLVAIDVAHKRHENLVRMSFLTEADVLVNLLAKLACQC